jgi:hypothetical protein
MNKKFYIIAMACFSILFAMQSCDKDEFAELNSDPSVISEPDIRFLITRSIQEMYNNDYTLWFYTYNGYVYPYTQAATASTSGNSTTFTEGGLTGLHNLYSTLVPSVDARMRINDLDQEQKEGSLAMGAVANAAQIYTAMVNMDYVGGFPYSEAGMANYTTPPLLTPKVDTEQELLDLWLTELHVAIENLQKTDQFSLGGQDLIYRSDYNKWMKFCNLLKLRIAARLVNANRTKAIDIAEEVARSTYMDELADDFLFNEGINYYGTGNGVGGGWTGYAGQNLINFLRENRDPRLRFIFRKNEYSPEVIDAIIETNGVDGLPTQILDIINLTVDNKFDSWKAGYEEPWGRYWGVPVSTDAAGDDEFFKQENFYATKADGSGRKSYTWSSVYEEKNQRSAFTYTYATKPGGSVLREVGSEASYYVLLGSAAETNLYLAEFSLLGADLPKTATEYFQKGVSLSVARMDDLASRHENPFYSGDPVLDTPADGATMLKDGEITALLAQDALLLNGTDDLEKVYIQQYVNNLLTPGDLWTTVRRSGIPKVGSAYFAWEDFGIGNVPRRVIVNAPDEADLMYENWMNYYQSAGFTAGDNTSAVLSSERLWFDKQNPNYGAGPK